jgi:hypothetical protein
LKPEPSLSVEGERDEQRSGVTKTDTKKKREGRRWGPGGVGEEGIAMHE